tara:strand:- start:7903 stop:8115 length:213 start_codon:yes stop_codon:yes gene_type:complete
MSDDNRKRDYPNRFLITKEAAKLLRVNSRTMDNWRSKGTGPAWRKHGGKVVYAIEELERYSGDDNKTHVG